jgi:hypothetical protein
MNCGAGTKKCGTQCVPLDSPATGCADPACTPCPSAHTTSGCSAGVCTVVACEANWANCDSKPDNGCETDLMNDPLNCGSCTKNCRALLNAAPDNQCQGGQCAISSRIGCKGGWLSCDNNPNNGCEKQSEPTNCGDCGDVCAMGMACRVHTEGAFCECTNDAACSWGGTGTCEPDPQWVGFMSCHCGGLYCGAPGRCGDQSQGMYCRYF